MIKLIVPEPRCPECGEKVAATNDICPHCGELLDDGEEGNFTDGTDSTRILIENYFKNYDSSVEIWEGIPRFDLRVPIPPRDKSEPLRDWWHDILRRYGRFQCYGVFLALPSDKEASEYLTDYDEEIDLISGEDCLIMAVTHMGFREYGYSDDLEFTEPLDEDDLEVILEDHVWKGLCLQIAREFKVRFDEFPCLLLFNDIRSSDHVKVTLSDMSAEEIGRVTRSVFSSIQEAVGENRDPLRAVVKHRNKLKLQKRGKIMISEVVEMAEKTFGALMEAVLKAKIG